MKKGLLIIGHGSRTKDAKKGFMEMVDIVRERTDEYIVRGAFMEISEPFIPQVVEEMVNENIKDIIVVPYFLYKGIHIKEDIPEIIKGLDEKYEDVNFKVSSPLGTVPALADILLERAESVE
ncbi:MAG: sirohydrochlorin chelatase [Senegalia sp. (in: firmicutes)]|uniref:sirohydrochlorin chelatase n=1 Tax=Senegalia sp. (in: firmicutes) TaxID=1924098 RepID=UPI003F97863E